MKQTIFLAIIIYIALAQQYVPIPKRQPGILLGNPDADVKIQLIYDPSCDDSYAFDQKFQEALTLLDTPLHDRISTRFTLVSLPYHTAAHKQSSGIAYIHRIKGSTEAVTLLRAFLATHDQYSDQALNHITIRDVMMKIAQKVNQLFLIREYDTLKQLVNGSQSEKTARATAKYVMGSIKAASTPTFRLNSVTVDHATSLTAQQIADLIKNLLN